MTFKDWFTQEYDRDLEKRIKDATRFSMSAEERDQTRAFLASYARMHPARARIAKKQSWFSWSLHPYPIIAAALIVVLGGSSVGAASLAENALPGDLLYPIKVNVNEEVRAALATTPEKKAVVALERAERRINELNELAVRGEVSSDVRADIDARVDEHVRKAEEETDLVDDGEKERRLVAMLRAHENLIAASEIGGGEQDVTFAAMVVAESTQKDVTAAEPEITTMVAMPAEDVAMTMSAPAPESETARTRALPDVANMPEEVVMAQKKVGVSEINMKSIKRQQKIAGERIEALKKLLERKGPRVEATALAHAQSELTAAQTALQEGGSFAENESWGDAAVRFNAAIRIAIDAREFLADAPRMDEKKKKDSDDNSGRSGIGHDGDDD